MMMMRRMMTIFYGGTGTKSTENQNSNAKQEDDERGRRRWSSPATNNNSDNDDNNNNNDTRPRHDKSDNQECPPHERIAGLTLEEDDDDDTDGSTDDDDEHGDLHQGRMEDDGDGGATMPSATGTLDRKTSQAPPTTCFQPRTLTKARTRSINNDKACRCHEDERTMTMTMTPRTLKMTTSQPDLMDEDHAVTLFEFVGWELTPSAHEHASNLSIRLHDDGRRQRDLTYKTDLM
jgi:hypothetical protein